MNDKTSFLMHAEYMELLDQLNDADFRLMVKAISEYNTKGTLIELPIHLSLAFILIKKRIDHDKEQWESKKIARSEAGKAGMAKRWNKELDGGCGPDKLNEPGDSSCYDSPNDNAIEVITNDNKHNEAAESITNDNKHNKTIEVITNDNKNNSVIDSITNITSDNKNNMSVSVSVSESVFVSESVSEKGCGEKQNEATDVACASDDARPSPSAPYDADVNLVVTAWNAMAKRTALPSIGKLDKKSTRYKQLLARIRDKDFQADGILRAIEIIEQTPFLRGETKTWRATIDWIVKPSNLTKVLEGQYSTESEKPRIRSSADFRKAENKAKNLAPLEDAELFEALAARRALKDP